MPVYDQHYHPWAGKPRPRWHRWLVITRYHLSLLFTGKGRNILILILVSAGFIHFCFLAYVYVMANRQILEQYAIPVERLPGINARFFLTEIIAQTLTVAILTLIMGAGLIADDRRDNAIPLYLSKPLTVTEYLLGKLGVLALPILGITAVPTLLVFVLHWLGGGGKEFILTYWRLPFAIVALSVLIALFCGALMLMASSLVKKGAIAGVVVVGLFIGHNVLAGVLNGIFDSRKFMIISLQFDFYRLGLWLFGLEHVQEAQEFPFSGLAAAGVILAATALCWAILWRQVRPVEVVK
ncbi:MAG: ABC transporter permease [Candidatus Sumerlaeia bacterium]|nr:ABC transporter permease [Candidatus Sumerlaeia bacterium]